MPQMLEAVAAPASMFRGVDYLGSDTEYHYFEYKREMARDIFFRVNRAEYSPPDEWGYCRWWTKRREFCYREMILEITTVSAAESRFQYRIGSQVYETPTAIPVDYRQKIRLIQLPSKCMEINQMALRQLKPCLNLTADVLILVPTSGLRINQQNPLLQ